MPEPKKHPPISVPDLTAERLQALRELLPEAFSEGKIDFEKLRAALGNIVDDAPERYSFSWAGKRDAIRLLQTPTRATLTPCPEESLDSAGNVKAPPFSGGVARAMPEAISLPTGDRHAGEAPARDDNQSQNIFIEGDNLEALKLLYKPYFGRIKMIYIDPPYNTGNDFIYPDDYSDPLGRYLELTGQQDAGGNLLTSSPETGGRYHSAWLSMMYPRLFLARQLLREDGVIFVSIDDHEVHNLRLLMNEIFGEDNFIANIVWRRTVSKAVSGKGIAVSHDHILCYGYSDSAIINKLPVTDETGYKNPDNDPRGPYKLQKLERTLEGARPTMTFAISTPTGEMTKTWSVTPKQYETLLHDNRIAFSKSGLPYYKQFLAEFEGVLPDTWWDKIGGFNQEATRELKALFAGDDLFSTPKPSNLIKTLLLLSTKTDSLILDFFAGSSSTAQAVLELNREDGGNRLFIMVQLPEPTGNPGFPTIAEIGKERIRRVVARMKKEREGQLPLETRETPEDLGFRVYKLAASHFKPWAGVDEKEAAAYAQQMELFRDPLVEGWTPAGVLTELALKHGFSLSMRFKALPGAKGLYRLSDPEREQSFYVSLAERLTLNDLSKFKLGKDDLFLCRDAALDDETAANLALQCRLETI